MGFSKEWRSAFGRVIDSFDDPQKLFRFMIYQFTIRSNNRPIYASKKNVAHEPDERLTDFDFKKLKVALPKTASKKDWDKVQHWFNPWQLTFGIDYSETECENAFILKAKCAGFMWECFNPRNDLIFFTIKYPKGLKKQPEIECYYGTSHERHRSRYSYKTVKTINDFNNFIGAMAFESVMLDNHRERMQHINPMLSDFYNWIPRIDMATTQGMFADEVKEKVDEIEKSYTEMLCHYIIACRDKENSKVLGELNELDIEPNREYVGCAMNKLKYDAEYPVFRNWRFFGCRDGVYGFEATKELLVILEHKDDRWKMTLQPVRIPNSKWDIRLCDVISRNTFVQALIESKMAEEGTLNKRDDS